MHEIPLAYLILRKIIKLFHKMSDFKAKMHQIKFKVGFVSGRT